MLEASDTEKMIAPDRSPVAAARWLTTAVAVGIRRPLIDFRNTLLGRVENTNVAERHRSLLRSNHALHRYGYCHERRCSVASGWSKKMKPAPKELQAQRSGSASMSAPVCLANVSARVSIVMVRSLSVTVSSHH